SPSRRCQLQPPTHVRQSAPAGFADREEEMILTRRGTLKLTMAGIAGLGATTFMPFHGRAQEGGDRYPTDKGEIVVDPIAHASFVMSVPGLVIYNDPVGGAAAYEGHPAPDLILITHEHGDHFDAPTLEAIV